jgi:uncharacterized lipoprotein NlpE involved in copper resistance
MKKIIFSLIACCGMIAFAACGQKEKSDKQENSAVGAVDAAHSSQNSLDWQGIYEGTIPCADCEGINVQITLNEDGTYQATYLYRGKIKENTPLKVSGKFEWNESGSNIKLDSKDIPPYYKVGENRLIQLDMAGKAITGELADMYILTKK